MKYVCDSRVIQLLGLKLSSKLLRDETKASTV